MKRRRTRALDQMLNWPPATYMDRDLAHAVVKLMGSHGVLRVLETIAARCEHILAYQPTADETPQERERCMAEKSGESGRFYAEAARQVRAVCLLLETEWGEQLPPGADTQYFLDRFRRRVTADKKARKASGA